MAKMVLGLLVGYVVYKMFFAKEGLENSQDPDVLGQAFNIGKWVLVAMLGLALIMWIYGKIMGTGGTSSPEYISPV